MVHWWVLVSTFFWSLLFIIGTLSMVSRFSILCAPAASKSWSFWRCGVVEKGRWASLASSGTCQWKWQMTMKWEQGLHCANTNVTAKQAPGGCGVDKGDGVGDQVGNLCENVKWILLNCYVMTHGKILGKCTSWNPTREMVRVTKQWALDREPREHSWEPVWERKTNTFL